MTLSGCDNLIRQLLVEFSFMRLQKYLSSFSVALAVLLPTFPRKVVSLFPANCLITHPIKRAEKQWEECQQVMAVLVPVNSLFEKGKNGQWILFIRIKLNSKLSSPQPPPHELSSEPCNSLMRPNV